MHIFLSFHPLLCSTILSFFPPIFNIFPLLSTRKNKKLRHGVERCTFRLEIRAQKHRRFKWMPADRWTGERHNAAIFFLAAISTYRPPFLSAVDYRSFHECKKQLITATCHLRKIPSLSSRLCSHSFYDNLVHMLLLPSNISLLLTLNCSVNFQKPVKHHSGVTSIQTTSGHASSNSAGGVKMQTKAWNPTSSLVFTHRNTQN